MKNSKLGLKAFGLAALGVLSMSAIFAGGAQAQGTLGEFLVGGSSALAVGKTISGTQEGLSGQLLVKGRNINIKCKTGSGSGEITAAKHGLLTLTFGGCKVFNHSTDAELTVCAVHSTGLANENIAAGALLLPVLHGGNFYVLAENKKNAKGEEIPFTTIEILGANCAVRGSYITKGAVVAEVLNNNTSLPLLDFSEAIQLLVGDTLSFLGFGAYINASAIAEVTSAGVHLKANLGVD